MICFTVGILSVLLLWWRVGVFLLLLRSNFVPLFLKLFHMVAAPQQQILESLAKRTFPAASAVVIFLELTSEGHPRCKSTWTLAEVTLKSEGNIDQDLNTLWLLWISRVIPGCSVPCSKYENFNMFSFSFWGWGGGSCLIFLHLSHLYQLEQSFIAILFEREKIDLKVKKILC